MKTSPEAEERGSPAADPRPMSTARIEEIDCLRGIAALLVVFHHHLDRFVSASIDSGASTAPFLWLTGQIDFGRMGVCLFFGISGFVIGRSILNHRAHHIRDFFISRFFRLYPAYWVSVLLALVLIPEPGWRVFAANLTMLQDFLGIQRMQGLYWTLTVELIFYALTIILFLTGAVSNMRRLYAVFLFFLFAVVAAAVTRRVTGFPIPFAHAMFVTFFLGGMLLRAREEGVAVSARAVRLNIALFLAALLTTSLAMYYDQTLYRRFWYQEFASMLFAVAIFFAGLHYHLANRYLALAGLWSYSIYLIHGPIGEVVIPAMKSAGIADTLPAILNLAISTTVVVAISAVIFRLIERPSISAGRALRNALDSPG
jgi:peptidoglycan/LPS O-acetylase OafA/YrhL